MRNGIYLFGIILIFSQMAGAVSLLKNGFVTWSEGDQMDRTLHYRTVTNGELGPVKIICQKGEAGGDIQGVISFDGKWIAFARKREAVCPSIIGQYNPNGEDDHNKFHCWSIYVARLDGELPATPIKVADEGYWPSWSDNSTGTVKTLCFGVYTKGEIWKATITDADNKFTEPVKYAAVEYDEESKTIEKIGPYDSPLITERGNWPDIHDFRAPVQVEPGSKLSAPNGFKIELTDKQLIVNTAFPGKHTIELFDVNGVKKANEVQTHSSRTVLSVKDYPRGIVILRVTYRGKSVQKQFVFYHFL